jgi:hypothetical protein
MKPTFTLDSNSRAQSDVKSKVLAHDITVGTPVITTAPYVTERGVLPTASKGFVKYIDETTSEVGILMEGMEPALVHWDNMLVLVPYDTEDLLAVLEFQRAKGATERRLLTYAGIAAAYLFALFQP